jgi:hypothetical protein
LSVVHTTNHPAKKFWRNRCLPGQKAAEEALRKWCRVKRRPGPNEYHIVLAGTETAPAPVATLLRGTGATLAFIHGCHPDIRCP